MIALASPTVHNAVQVSIVHQTQHHASWNAQKDFTVLQEQRHLLKIHVPRGTSTMTLGSKASVAAHHVFLESFVAEKALKNRVETAQEAGTAYEELGLINQLMLVL